MHVEIPEAVISVRIHSQVLAPEEAAKIIVPEWTLMMTVIIHIEGVQIMERHYHDYSGAVNGPPVRWNDHTWAYCSGEVEAKHYALQDLGKRLNEVLKLDE